MAAISIRYSTGSLSSQSTGLDITGSPLRGKNALGGRMAMSGPLGLTGKYLYYLDEDVYGLNYIWNNVSAQDNLDGVTTYRCLYLRIDSSILYNPKIYISNEPYVTWQFKIANAKNTECGVLIADEFTAPVDPGADSIWRNANSSIGALDLLAPDQSLGQGEYIYFWVKRTANKTITSGNLVTERFNIVVKGEE